MRTYVGTYDDIERRCKVVMADGVERPTASRLFPPPTPSPERELPHLAAYSADGFGWGHDGDGPSDLAHAILYRELATEVPASVYLRFRDEVVARFPVEGFHLPASEVWDWIRANRAFVEQHVFGVEPEQPVLAVVDPGQREGRDMTSAPVSEVVQGPSASKLVEACEEAWADIRCRHAELPEVVVVLGSGVERGRLVKLGHWWGGRWLADGQVRGEVLLAGEALHLEPKQVFEVLLHEAAHGINAARGVKDTSRGGRYHNERFAVTAREVGLEVQPMPPYGMARTELTPATEATYVDAIERLGDTMRIARQLQGIKGVGAEQGGEIQGGGPGAEAGRSRTAPSASCGCGRKLRMHPGTLAKGPVICGLCGSEFTVGAEVRQLPEAASSRPSNVDDSFVARRREALRSTANDDLRGRMLRDRERIASGVDDPSAWFEGSAPLLTKRLERIDAAVAELDDRRPDDPVRPVDDSTDQRVERWYAAYGTLDERPMVAADDLEQEQLASLARAVLRRDGSIRGPDLDLGPLDVAVGDRVVVVRPLHDGPPLGTPGDVVGVDHGSERCKVDFSTWGTLEIEPDSEAACAIGHDYAVVDLAQPVDPVLALEAERQRAMVLEREP
jgi:hypothetical protein